MIAGKTLLGVLSRQSTESNKLHQNSSLLLLTSKCWFFVVYVMQEFIAVGWTVTICYYVTHCCGIIISICWEGWGFAPHWMTIKLSGVEMLVVTCMFPGVYNFSGWNLSCPCAFVKICHILYNVDLLFIWLSIEL